MASKRTYAERHAENIKEGVSPALAAKQTEQHELDQPEMQEQILRPATVEVPLEDGSITLPTKLTLGQSIERKTMQVIQSLTLVVFKAVKDLSGDAVQDAQWFARNLDYVPLVVYKDAVQNIVADFLGILSQSPAQSYINRITPATVTTSFLLALRIVQEAKAAADEAGASDQKNVA